MTTSWEVLAEKLHGYADDLESLSPSVAKEIREIAYWFVPKLKYKTGVLYVVESNLGSLFYASWDEHSQAFRDAEGSLLLYGNHAKVVRELADAPQES